MVKKTQGKADMKLTNQMRATVFLALPVEEERARWDRGWQIARYLSQLNVTIVRIEEYIMVSVATIFVSHINSPNVQGY